MILLDTNILIYLRNGRLNEKSIDLLRSSTLASCNIIVAEVLGFKLIDRDDAAYFKGLFESMKNLPFDDAVTEKVIELRQTVNIKLPDAIIAATALSNNAELWTHNTDDFRAVAGLQLFDPISVL